MWFDWGTSVPMRGQIEVCIDLSFLRFMIYNILEDMVAWKLTVDRHYRHVLPLGVPYWHDPLRPLLFCAPDITPGVIPV